MASFAPRQDAATTTSDYTLAEGSNGTASGTTSSANGTSASLSTMNGSVATPVAAATSSVLGLSPSGGEASEASSEYGSADDQDVSMEIQMDGSEGGNSVGSLLDAEGDGDAEMMGPDSDPDHDQDQDADGEEPMRIDASLEEQDGGMMVQEDGKRVKVRHTELLDPLHGACCSRQKAVTDPSIRCMSSGINHGTIEGLDTVKEYMTILRTSHYS